MTIVQYIDHFPLSLTWKPSYENSPPHVKSRFFHKTLFFIHTTTFTFCRWSFFFFFAQQTAEHTKLLKI